MRILIIANYAPPHVGGIEVLVERETRWLASEEHDVCLLTSDAGDGPLPQYPANVYVERIPAWNVMERRFDIPWPFYSPRLLLALWKHVRRCDVLHAHGFLNLTTLMAFSLARLVRNRPRTLLTEHAGRNWYKARWKHWLQEIAIHTIGRLNVLLADTCYACHLRVLELLRRLKKKDGDVQFLLFPVDTRRFQPPTDAERADARRRLGWDSDRPRVLFVGRFVQRKGIDLLLQAQDPDYDLVICGPGNPADFSDYDLSGVSFLPPRTQAELVDLYHAADVLVLPSRSEGNLVLVAQEALLCGLPVVLGDDPGLSRFSDCAGLHFCSLSPDSIRDSLKSILASSSVCDAGKTPLASYFPSEEDWVREITTERLCES